MRKREPSPVEITEATRKLEPLTEEDMRAADDLDRRATPGPWMLATSNSFRRITSPRGRDGDVLFGALQADGQGDLTGSNVMRDLEFIVAARTLLPRAVASCRLAESAIADVVQQDFEIMSLRSELARANERITQLESTYDRANQELAAVEHREDVLNAENADVRSQIEFLQGELVGQPKTMNVVKDIVEYLNELAENEHLSSSGSLLATIAAVIDQRWGGL